MRVAKCRGPSILQRRQEGHHVLDLLGAQDGLASPRRRDARKPIGSMIRRHDRGGVDSARVDDPQAQLSFGPALAGAREIGGEIALEALLRERPAVAEQAQAELTVGDYRAAPGRIAPGTGERLRDRVLRPRPVAARRAQRAAGGGEGRDQSHPNASVVIVRNQASASTASALRVSRGASCGLTPPEPGTSASCPFVGWYTPATEIP